MGKFVGFLFRDPVADAWNEAADQGWKQCRYETQESIRHLEDDLEEKFSDMRKRQKADKDFVFRDGYDFGYRGGWGRL
jgi:hypothetical protein